MGSVISPTAYNLATEGALNLFSKIEDLGSGSAGGGSASAINYIQNIIDMSDDPHGMSPDSRGMSHDSRGMSDDSRGMSDD